MFAGLPPSAPGLPDNGEFLVTLHEVPPTAVDVDAAGVAVLDEDRVVQDPIAGEVFDTPEFAASHAGAVLEQEETEQAQADARAEAQGTASRESEDGRGAH